MQLWTYEHAIAILPAAAAMVLIAFVLHITIGKKDIRIRMIPFHVLSFFIVLLEIGKQAVSLHRGYDLYHLPFHFCSLFIFVLPFMSLYKGRHTQAVRGITAALCAAVFLMMMLYPNLIFSAGDVHNFTKDYLSFHTVAFHDTVIFALILIVALRLHEPQKTGEPRSVAVFTLLFCVVSATMAQLLKTNFNNFYSCNIGPLEGLRLAIQESLGYGATQVLYVLIVTVLDILFVQMSYWFYRGARHLVTNRLFRKKLAVK